MYFLLTLSIANHPQNKFNMLKSSRVKTLLITSILLIGIIEKSTAQIDSLRGKIETIARSINGNVGVAVHHLDNGDTLTFNGNHRFPMQSVYKFPVALAILHEVDNGKFSLDQKIHVTKEDLHPDTWSPLRNKFPNGNIDVSLSELITFTVSHGDNNTCDILFHLVGGPKSVENYMRKIGMIDIGIVSTEAEMHQKNDLQYDNWCTPMSMTKLFVMFYSTNLLKTISKDFLWKTLVATTTGPKRMKGLLPKETIVGHKTGTGGRNEKGTISAINDAGIIVLPNGEHIALTFFISNSSETDAAIENVIAKISKACYDHYAIMK
jgi:beta-lactamase class A